MELTDVRAVVTGAASGIGRALAAELVARGARVALADIDDERVQCVAAELGANAYGVACNVASHASVVALADSAERAFGPVNLVFANAGVGVSGPVFKARPEELDWIFGVNVRGAFNTATVFAQRAIARNDAIRICVTASEHSIGLQHTGSALYTASKQAVFGLVDVMRAEAPPNVTMSALCPGLAATEIYRSRMKSPFPPSDESQLAIGKEVMGRGVPAAEVAHAAIEGVLRGDFLIVTHPISIRAAQKRHEEIVAAFDAQAPWTADAERHDVTKVIASVLAERADASARVKM